MGFLFAEAGSDAPGGLDGLARSGPPPVEQAASSNPHRSPLAGAPDACSKHSPIPLRAIDPRPTSVPASIKGVSTAQITAGPGQTRERELNFGWRVGRAGRPPAEVVADETITAHLQPLLAHARLSDAARTVAHDLGVPRGRVYDLGLALKGNDAS